MRYSAVATDPLDFTRALRMEFGLDAEPAPGPVAFAAVADPGGDAMLELMAIAHDAQAPVVMMALRSPCKLDRPAEITMFEPLGGSIAMRIGYTLWAGHPSEPLLIIGRDGRGPALVVTPRGLAERPVPLGIEATARWGIERATERFSERMLAIGRLRDVMPMAA